MERRSTPTTPRTSTNFAPAHHHRHPRGRSVLDLHVERSSCRKGLPAATRTNERLPARPRPPDPPLRDPRAGDGRRLSPAPDAGGAEATSGWRTPGHAGRPLQRLYGDVVHAGRAFAETLLAARSTCRPACPGPYRWIRRGRLRRTRAACPVGANWARPYKLPDGYTMVWDAPPQPSTASTALQRSTSACSTRQGKPAAGMQPYLGMAGHAAFVKTDGTVFAHTHPEGSAAMADVMLASASVGSGDGNGTPEPIAARRQPFPTASRRPAATAYLHPDEAQPASSRPASSTLRHGKPTQPSQSSMSSGSSPSAPASSPRQPQT